MKKLLVITILGAVFSGCALNVAATNPRPNFNIPQSGKTLSLVLDTNIGDAFTIPPSNGVTTTNVTGWHKTLRNGFENGFKDHYKLTGGRTDLVLTLKRADMGFAPTSVLVDQRGENYGAASIRSQIVYNAQLVSSDGTIIGSSANTAESKKSITDPKEMSQSVGDAVESMYEIIADEIFKQIK